MAKNTLVGLKELRVNLNKYVKGVERGSSYTVLRRSKPLFRISPVDTEDETGWDTIFDADRDNKGKGIPGGEVLRILRKIKTNERARKTVSKIK